MRSCQSFNCRLVRVCGGGMQLSRGFFRVLCIGYYLPLLLRAATELRNWTIMVACCCLGSFSILQFRLLRKEAEIVFDKQRAKPSSAIISSHISHQKEGNKRLPLRAIPDHDGKSTSHAQPPHPHNDGEGRGCDCHCTTATGTCRP